ncbi:MAG: hypothetical protein ABIO76_07850 [Ginsengibacter sp.]
MKKITAIFFFAVYLFSTTEAHQLLKLPLIFEHFSDHEKADNKITFLEFLDLHYMHGSPKDGGYARDMQLPFKTSSDCIFGMMSFFTPLLTPVIILKPAEIHEKKSYLVLDQFILSSYISTIWQPPKSC